MAWSEDGFSVENLTAREHELIERHRAALGTKLASELVRSLIDETGYDALLAGLPRGPQRLANLRKVLDWLRETERGARTTTAEVARKLAERVANPPQVPEAALLDPAQNAVTIMTAHGSKGLTKRVVVVPDTSFSDSSDKGFARVFFDEAKTPRLGIRVTAPDKTKVESPGFKQANQRAREIGGHERKNLLYVAMTRARDLVITSATIGHRPAGWYKDLEPMLGKEIPELLHSTLSAASAPAPEATRNIPSIGDFSAALATLPAPPKQPTFSRAPATRLAKEQDELEPRIDAEPRPFQSMENAAALGSLGHAVLEHLALNDWQGSVEEWLEALRDEFGASKAQALKLADRVERTRELMIGLTADMKALRPEFPFVLRDGDKLVDGTIDLLCETDEGFAIFDYKFTESSDDVLREDYRSQMEIYRTAAERAYPSAGESSVHLVAVSSAPPRLTRVEI